MDVISNLHVPALYYFPSKTSLYWLKNVIKT